MLIRSGATPKVVQTLARHSDARLTVGIYSKLRPDEERRALAGVRSIGTDAGKPEPEPEPEPMRRTGSDAADVLASGLASDSAARCRPASRRPRPAVPRPRLRCFPRGKQVGSIPAASTNPSLSGA